MAARIYVDANLRWSLVRAIGTTLAFAVNFIVSPSSRFTAPAFGLLKDVMPMWGWGLVFLAAFLTMAAGFVGRRRTVMIQALTITSGVHTFISCGYLTQALIDSHASFVGAIAFGAIAASIGGTAGAVSRSCRADR